METTVVNIKDHKDWKAEGGVYIGRAFRGQIGSVFSNKFKIGKDGDRDEVITKYRNWFYRKLERDGGFYQAVLALRGKMLVCWCVPEPCHGGVIKEFLAAVRAS